MLGKQITVRDLIAILQRVPQDMPAAVRDEKGNWSAVGNVLTGQNFVKIEGTPDQDI
jgi:hypothetical protein